MMVAFLAMVGARDVQVVNEAVLASQGVSLSLQPSPVPNAQVLKLARKDGESLWQAYQNDPCALHSALDVPILRAGLEHVLEYVQDKNLPSKVDVALFFTDNPSSVPQNIRDNDSLWLAKLAKCWLESYFGARGLTLEVNLVQIDGSPVNHKEMLEFFEKQLPTLFPPDKVVSLFSSQTGGVPPTYEAMFLQAVRFYRDACIPLYVLPDGTVNPVALGEFLLDRFYREQAQALLSKHHYAPLADVMEERKFGTKFHRALCRMAAYRVLFDFERAKKAIESLGTAPSLPPMAKNLLHNLNFLLKPPSVPTPNNPNPNWQKWFNYLGACLKELYWGMEIVAQQEAWADFVGRLVRLCEVVFELAFEKTFQLPANKPKRLRGSLEELKQRRQRFSFRSNHVVTTLAPLIELASQCAERRAGYPLMERVHQFVQKIRFQRLDNLRDNTILWHGFRGVSKEEVVKACNVGSVDDLLKPCRELLEWFGVSLGNNPYEAVQCELSNALKL